MGWYSIIHVLHDCVDSIKKNPEMFVNNMCDQIDEYDRQKEHHDISAGGCVNAAHIAAQDHADSFHMIVVGANSSWDFGYIDSWSPEWRDAGDSIEEKKLNWLKAAAHKMGYKLVKRK